MSITGLESLAGKSVFVTGHTGFKGSWLCLWLHHLGARINGYALQPPTEPNNFGVSSVADVLHDHHIGDIRDEVKLHSALIKADPDVVLHLAAQSVVREGYENPRETFEVNVIGVASILDGVRKLNKPCVVLVVTSDKCYENIEQVWGYKETDAFGDHDPYGGSKGAAELVVRYYRHSYFPPERYHEHGIKLASARAGNVIGGGDWTRDALIVDIIKAMSAEKPVQIRNPQAIRPWQHVLAALSGYLTLTARLLDSDDLSFCSGWNIGPVPGNELPVKDIVELFLNEWGHGSWENVCDPNAPREANILRLSIDKAIWQLNWKPGWNVHQTLRQTVVWYKYYFENRQGNMREFSIDQIKAYEATLAEHLQRKQ